MVDFWQSGRLTPSGLALDLGCGTATNVAYLAGLGLQALGVEIAPSALRRGQQRLHDSGLGRRAWLIEADVARLPLLGANTAYILDIGCFHGLYPAMRTDYTQSIIMNLAPQGYYHLYAFDRCEELGSDPARAHRGVEENEIVERFSPWLDVVDIQRARPDRYPCRWYLLRNRAPRWSNLE